MHDCTSNFVKTFKIDSRRIFMHHQYRVAKEWRSVVGMLFAALIIALTIGSAGQTPPVQAAPAGATELGFFMIANKERVSEPLCIGELSTVQVLVYRLKVINGVDEAPDAVTGVSVDGYSKNPNVGQISPRKNTNMWASTIYPGAADFVFTAEQEGQTAIVFDATIVTPGWFGTNWQGGSKAVSASVDVQVIPCRFKVNIVSTFAAQSVKLVATMDGVLKVVSAGQFTGSATVNWARAYTLGARDCSGLIDIASSQANLTGKLDGNGRLAVEVTYLPAALTHSITCGGSRTIHAVVIPDPLKLTVPATGGLSTQSQGLSEPTYYAMRGSASIVVVPEKCSGRESC
jgi:hypothetical protein